MPVYSRPGLSRLRTPPRDVRLGPLLLVACLAPCCTEPSTSGAAEASGGQVASSDAGVIVAGAPSDAAPSSGAAGEGVAGGGAQGSASAQGGASGAGGDTSQGGDTQSGLGGDAAGGGTSEEPSLLAGACQLDTDCDPAGGVCVTLQSQLWGNLGPAHGYCSLPCELPAQGMPDPCTSTGANAECIAAGPGGEGYCVLRCTRGTPDDPQAKCQGRSDLSCDIFDVSGGVGICAPSCGGDTDCPDGSQCSFLSGFCEPEPEVANLGASCNPDTTLDTVCPGRCIDVGNQLGFCAGFCTVGADLACGSGAAPREFVCALSADGTVDAVGNLLSGDGDLGLCVPSCDCNADCVMGAICLELSSATRSFVGRAGLCAAPVEGETGLVTCP